MQQSDADTCLFVVDGRQVMQSRAAQDWYFRAYKERAVGLLIEGIWHDQWYKPSKTGEFIRESSQFRNWIYPDQASAEKHQSPFWAEADRYHLYVSLACPWAHRTLIYRAVKGLEHLITVSVVDPLMLENGWQFAEENPDHLYQKDFLHQIYTAADADYTGRVTVPVLWDKKLKTIVNNESSEIIRIFNQSFDQITGNAADYYPEPLHDDINQLNEWIYATVNNGVYRAGFATTQQAYDEAVDSLFHSLDELEQILSENHYLTGDNITEADWRLFPTLIRFDPVYVGHFKCDRKRIQDYPALRRYVRDLYHHTGVASSVNIEHIREHYYASHRMINPHGIIPAGCDHWWE